MSFISEEMISVNEAKAALRCMELSGISYNEALETLDDFAIRIRKVTTASILEKIIENGLTQVQREFVREYWYNRKNTSQIGREFGVSQASVYRTLNRANEAIKRQISPLIEYQSNIENCTLEPLYLREIMEICAAANYSGDSLCSSLRNIRISYAISSSHLASALKISLKELEDIESGKRIPSVTTIMRYSVLFGLEIKMEFINGKGVYSCKKV